MRQATVTYGVPFRAVPAASRRVDRWLTLRWRNASMPDLTLPRSQRQTSPRLLAHAQANRLHTESALTPAAPADTPLA
jgi:hypothetical protein